MSLQKQIDAMEREYGAQLIGVSGRAVALAAQNAQLLADKEALMAEKEALLKRIDELRGRDASAATPSPESKAAP